VHDVETLAQPVIHDCLLRLRARSVSGALTRAGEALFTIAVKMVALSHENGLGARGATRKPIRSRPFAVDWTPFCQAGIDIAWSSMCGPSAQRGEERGRVEPLV
jgi:hypothetical protein